MMTARFLLPANGYEKYSSMNDTSESRSRGMRSTNSARPALGFVSRWEMFNVLNPQNLPQKMMASTPRDPVTVRQMHRSEIRDLVSQMVWGELGTGYRGRRN